MRHSKPYTLEVNPSGLNSGPTAVAVVSVIRRDVFREVLDYSFNPSPVPNRVDDTLAANVTRLLIFVSNPPGGSALIKLTQDTTIFIADQVDGDATYVLNVAP